MCSIHMSGSLFSNNFDFYYSWIFIKSANFTECKFRANWKRVSEWNSAKLWWNTMLPIKSAQLFLNAIIFRYSIMGKSFNIWLECRLFAYFAVEFKCILNFIQCQVVDGVSNFSVHISQLLGLILMNFPFSLSFLFSVSRCMGWCRRINSKNVSRFVSLQTYFRL